MSTCNDNCTCEGLAAPHRNNYFYGKLLDEAALRMEQGYLNQKRWMLNRHTLGKGVVCGLQVTYTEKWVCISPGLAIDGRGREIVVPEPIKVDPWQLTDDCGYPSGRLPNDAVHEVYICLAFVECPTDYTPVLVTDCDSQDRKAPSTIVEKVAVIVKELATGAPPTLPRALDPDLCAALSGTDAEAKRKGVCGVLSKRDCIDNDPTPCVVVASRITLTKEEITAVDVCGARPRIYSNPQLFEMLLCRAGGGGTGTPGPVGPVGPLGPVGPPGPRISIVKAEKIDDCEASPWARLDPDPADPDTDPSLQDQILTLGIPRGCDGPPGKCFDETLTKITDINWPHDSAWGWKVFLSDGLQVGFSDEIAAKPAIDAGWILVSLELSGGARRPQQDPLLNLIALMVFLIWPPGTRFVYRLEPAAITVKGDAANPPRHYAQFIPPPQIATFISLLDRFVSDFTVLCRVEIKCDFLVDKNGKPVDGNHLSGILPASGDGITGGEFESWFRLQEIPRVPSSVAASTATTAAELSGYLNELDKLLPGTGGLTQLFRARR